VLLQFSFLNLIRVFACMRPSAKVVRPLQSQHARDASTETHATEAAATARVLRCFVEVEKPTRPAFSPVRGDVMIRAHASAVARTGTCVEDCIIKKYMQFYFAVRTSFV
jgi:hypothetical protein